MQIAAKVNPAAAAYLQAERDSTGKPLAILIEEAAALHQAQAIVARGHGGEVRIGWFDINVGTPALRAYYEGSLSMPRVKLPAGLIDLSYSTSPTHMIVRWVP